MKKKIPILSESDIKRFNDKISIFSNKEECWNWPMSKLADGYGVFSINNAKIGLKMGFKAHVISYLINYGSLDENKVIDHKCRNKSCVNPDHLEEVTIRVNVVVRGIGPSAINSRKTHCLKGHELSSDNIYFKKKDGARMCRECLRETKRKLRREGRIK